MDGGSKRSKRQHDDEEPLEETNLPSLSRPISPPHKKKKKDGVIINSPWQLTWIRDLPESLNQDAVTLKDLLGDPLISECWQFNYLHDIRFVMEALDPDTRHLVNVHIVHGFWKQEDRKRIALQEDAAAFQNVKLHVAPMPEMFGTHHSKMMVLFRHDDSAQVIIHTANMIAKDWTNMTNGVWKSPKLPLVSDGASPAGKAYDELPMGSGERFKSDLLSYLRSYDRRKITCKALVDKLNGYDFCAVRAALIASVPGIHSARDVSQPAWGWAALKRCLREVECSQGNADLVVQISSIATLGAKDDWLQKSLFGCLSKAKGPNPARPKFKVVFPTADEVRRSLDGYNSGASIHTRIQSAQQAKQLQYLRPIFHHWANDSPNGKGAFTRHVLSSQCADGASVLPDGVKIAESGRDRAAPHIKTYIRYNDKGTIDWAMLTSANLSKQAWGESERTTGELRIASWEIGVLVWPDLIEKGSLLVPSFKTDTPDKVDEEASKTSAIGLRMPYSLPLQQYEKDETPWVVSMAHREPDRLGQVWVA